MDPMASGPKGPFFSAKTADDCESRRSPRFAVHGIRRRRNSPPGCEHTNTGDLLPPSESSSEKEGFLLVELWFAFMAKDLMTCVCNTPVEVRATVIPIIIYWVYSGMYMALEHTGKYRLRRRQDGGDKNLASKWQVFFGVLIHQAFHAAISVYLFKMINPGCAASTNQPRLKIAGRLVAGLLVMDTWQYFLHRLMHANSLIYRYSHSKHHRLVAPYAFGALYYHTPEGLLLNTGGSFVAMAVTGMPPCAAMVFFSLVAIRTVDIHCGMWIPWHPLNLLFGNNAAHHELHHQPDGGDFNFSQPFFVFWDRILGTQLPYTVEKAEGGGFDLKVTKKA